MGSELLRIAEGFSIVAEGLRGLAKAEGGSNQAVLEAHQSPDVWDEEGLQRCEEEEVLRETIIRIVSTALQDDGTFWSVRAEEIGYGF